jgi:hypothetical protein
MPKKQPEYVEGREALENFDNALSAVVRVPHSEIKAKLDAEKTAKLPRKSKQTKKTVK